MGDDKNTTVVGPEIRRRREALGMTLRELGQRSGITPNYIGGVEMGKREPSVSTLVALARGLSAEPGDLLGAGGFGPEATEAARLIETLPERHREPVLVVLRALVKISAEGSAHGICSNCDGNGYYSCTSSEGLCWDEQCGDCGGTGRIAPPPGEARDGMCTFCGGPITAGSSCLRNVATCGDPPEAT